MSQNRREISRVTRSKKEAQRTYNRISRWYDLLEGGWERRARIEGLQRLDAGDGEHILEIGFGTGNSLLSLASSVGASGRVYGIDLSPKMVQITVKKLSKNDLNKTIELILGDGARLPFKDCSFDAIFMSFALELFDTQEIARVLSDCRRVLKTQGRICTISLSKIGGSELMKSLYEWGHGKFPKLLDCRPIFVRESVEDAGFLVDNANSVSVWGLPVEIVLGIKSQN